MKNVYYLPDYKTNNNGLVDALKVCDFKFIDEQISLYNIKKIMKIDLFILNWYENIYYNENIIISYIKKQIYLNLIKLCRKEIIFVIHNRQPHIKNLEIPNIYLSHKLLKYTIKKADYVVMLSNHTLDSFSKKDQKYFHKYGNKFFYIPHRDFHHLYKEVKNTKWSGLRMLFLGSPEVYKNPEILLKVMNDLTDKNISLTFEGSCDSNTKKRLKTITNNEKVFFNFNFVKDEDLSELFSNYDLCIYPFSLDCCINSSSVLLSLSLHKTVISSNISTLRDIPSNLYYSYTYNNNNEHEEQLKKIIINAYEDKLKNPEVFIHKGDLCAAYLRKNNNQRVINENMKHMLETKQKKKDK
ncbi:MAG: hypothetical protein IK024_12700 [Treponema sp.]|nr:hypothetical protein [Treponema sp.]